MGLPSLLLLLGQACSIPAVGLCQITVRNLRCLLLLQEEQGVQDKVLSRDCEEGGAGPRSETANHSNSRQGGLTAHEQLGLTCHALFGHETLTLTDYVLGLVSTKGLREAGRGTRL